MMKDTNTPISKRPMGRPRLLPEQRMLQFTLSISPGLKAALLDYAEATGRTPTAAARRWMELGAAVAEGGMASP